MAFDDKFRLSVHAVITNEEGKVLLVKATYASMGWGLPGGSLDPGETVHEALLRECKEELGVDIEVLYLSGIYFHKAYDSHTIIFRCNILGNPSIRLSEEHSEYKYFALNELSPIQLHRINDCINFDGQVKSAKF